ncbi:MAG: hypothetical protein V7609_3077 [Verrucomicrobiota bacterium]
MPSVKPARCERADNLASERRAGSARWKKELRIRDSDSEFRIEPAQPTSAQATITVFLSAKVRVAAVVKVTPVVAWVKPAVVWD